MKNNIRCQEVDKSSPYLKEIERIYISSFPENERIEFEEIKNTRFINSKLLAFFDNSVLLGFSYISILGSYVYIIYYAIDEKFRNQGYGTQILKMLINMFKDKVKVLCIERPSTNCLSDVVLFI